MDRLAASCEETRECLSAYLEHDVRGFRRWRVAAHLAGCERCRSVLQSLTRAVQHVQQLGRTDFAPRPAPSVGDAVVGRIERERNSPA